MAKDLEKRSTTEKKKKRKMPQREILKELEIKNLKLENKKLTEAIMKLLLKQRKLEKEEKKIVNWIWIHRNQKVIYRM